MSNLLQTGVAWLAGQVKEHASTSVTYDRGGSALTGLAATFGKSQAEAVSEDGVGIRAEFFDFIITAADLVLDGAATLPKRGDVISWTDAGVERRFEVANLGDSHYRPCDPQGRLIRIHTVKARTL